MAIRNALVPFRLPEAADVGNLTNPLMAGLQTYRQGMAQQFEGDRALAREDMARQQLKLSQNADARATDKSEIERLGNLARVINDDPNDATAGQRWQSVIQGNPKIGPLLQKYGVDPRDHRTGAKFLMAEIGAYKDPSSVAKEKAQLGLVNAQAGYYRSRSALADAKTAPQQTAAPTATSDPLQNYGMDDEGRIVPLQQPAPAQSYGYGDGSETFGLPDYQQERPNWPTPMKLGGPRDDIDASLRIDEGRPASRGTQIAQATQGGTMPSLSQIEMARAQSFGPTGVTSPQIPGVITDAGRNRRMDVQATREAQGQRAIEGVPQEQQDRLRRFREDQERWSWVYKRQPRAGYYYGTDGREMPLSDKNYKGDKEAQAVALFNIRRFEGAIDSLLGKAKPTRSDPNAREGNYSYPSRLVQGALDVGEVGQSYSDAKGAAENIAYMLSGKTVTNAERESFTKQFAPQPMDSEWRILAKRQRLRSFYDAWLTSIRGGEGFENAFRRAMATYDVRNPDGTPAGDPAAASAGRKPEGPAPSSAPSAAPAEDLSKIPTQELIRRLQGNR